VALKIAKNNDNKKLFVCPHTPPEAVSEHAVALILKPKQKNAIKPTIEYEKKETFFN